MIDESVLIPRRRREQVGEKKEEVGEKVAKERKEGKEVDLG